MISPWLSGRGENVKEWDSEFDYDYWDDCGRADLPSLLITDKPGQDEFFS